MVVGSRRYLTVARVTESARSSDSANALIAAHWRENASATTALSEGSFPAPLERSSAVANTSANVRVVVQSRSNASDNATASAALFAGALAITSALKNASTNVRTDAKALAN